MRLNTVVMYCIAEQKSSRPDLSIVKMCSPSLYEQVNSMYYEELYRCNLYDYMKDRYMGLPEA